MTNPSDNCVFCRIAAGTEPAQIVHRSATSCAFLDHAPAAPGHVLVIPTEHVETLPATGPERAGALFVTVQRVSDAIEHPTGFLSSNRTAVLRARRYSTRTFT